MTKKPRERDQPQLWGQNTSAAAAETFLPWLGCSDRDESGRIGRRSFQPQPTRQKNHPVQHDEKQPYRPINPEQPRLRCDYHRQPHRGSTGRASREKGKNTRQSDHHRKQDQSCEYCKKKQQEDFDEVAVRADCLSDHASCHGRQFHEIDFDSGLPELK
jgi:hypothetical protein